MKTTLFLAMLLVLTPQNQTAVISHEGYPLVVVS
jgi:hypothetical protein